MADIVQVESKLLSVSAMTMPDKDNKLKSLSPTTPVKVNFELREFSVDTYVSNLKSVAAFEDGDCGHNTEQLPNWFEKAMFDRAKEVIRKNFMSMVFIQLCGLYLLVYIKTIRDVLLTTGRSKSVADLYRRYLSTVTHVKHWFDGDFGDTNDMAFKSITQVREMHKRVSLKVNSNRMHDKKEVFISQFDMVLTQFAFAGLLVLFPNEFGCSLNEYDLQCVLHFWRFVGYMLGIDEKYNLFATKDCDEIKERCKYLLEIIKLQVKCEQSKSAVEMSDGIVRGVNAYIPLLKPQSLRKFLFQIIDLNIKLKLHWFETFTYLLMKLHFYVFMKVRVMVIFFNFLLQTALRRTALKKDVIFKNLQTVYGSNEQLA